MKSIFLIPLVGALLVGCAFNGPPGVRTASWQLLRIQDGGSVTTPDVKAKYTIDFDPLGRVSMRVDCNYGSGKWASAAPGEVRFSELAFTKAACARGSLHDRIVKDLPSVRGYTVKDNRLLLSVADGRVYELEPSATMGTVGVP